MDNELQQMTKMRIAMTPCYQVPELTLAEQALVTHFNAKQWKDGEAVALLQTLLQAAAEVELATIPIYLGTYYTINRTPGSDKPAAPDAFPKTPLSRYADQAGALIMSVAVEEMLHMSLACNLLFSAGKMPELYKKAPDEYPAYLPLHARNTPCGTDNDPQNIPIPLAGFSFEQLSHFLAIEYPESKGPELPDGKHEGAKPQSENWDTIGQLYSYVRCLIESDAIKDSDFNSKRNSDQQIASGDYSPNNIDTVYPTAEFDYQNPKPTPEADSTAKVTGYASAEDSHVGPTQLMQITDKKTAVEAITTICFQGEGADHTKFDDPSHMELSHYYKFLTVQSELTQYNDAYIAAGDFDWDNVAPEPRAPNPPAVQFSPEDLSTFVFPTPANPKASDFGQAQSELVNIADGLFQYMLIMTETIYKVPSSKQQIYFYRSMHQSMIWVMDKLFQAMRNGKSEDGQYSLCPTFANIDLGDRKDAYANLCTMVANFQKTYVYLKESDQPDFIKNTDVAGYLQSIVELPDVSAFWSDNHYGPTPPYLAQPTGLAGKGTNPGTPAPATKTMYAGPFAGVPKWPTNPPVSSDLPEGALRHACMGLNSCKNQGRTLQNDCAGLGYCSTTLAYDPNDPSNGQVYDHTCHVLNDCRDQGGCGLYGTEEEFKTPGHNDCQSMGSCATPINAERFFTDGDNRGGSVWAQAREAFKERVWPDLVAKNPDLPPEPPEVPGPMSNPNLFQYGPTIGWMEYDNDGAGMTACGASGMSGAGSCA